MHAQTDLEVVGEKSEGVKRSLVTFTDAVNNSTHSKRDSSFCDCFQSLCKKSKNRHVVVYIVHSVHQSQSSTKPQQQRRVQRQALYPNTLGSNQDIDTVNKHSIIQSYTNEDNIAYRSDRHRWPTRCIDTDFLAN